MPFFDFTLPTEDLTGPNAFLNDARFRPFIWTVTPGGFRVSVWIPQILACIWGTQRTPFSQSASYSPSLNHNIPAVMPLTPERKKQKKKNNSKPISHLPCHKNRLEVHGARLERPEVEDVPVPWAPGEHTKRRFGVCLRFWGGFNLESVPIPPKCGGTGLSTTLEPTKPQKGPVEGKTSGSMLVDRTGGCHLGPWASVRVLSISGFDIPGPTVAPDPAKQHAESAGHYPTNQSIWKFQAVLNTLNRGVP